MTSLFLLLFSTLVSALYRSVYNYIFLFNFMLVFQLALGPVVRSISYPFEDNVLLTLVVSLYVLISSIFLMIFLRIFNIQNLKKTLSFNFISDNFFVCMLILYFLLVSLFAIKLASELQHFTLLEVRAFYHTSRTTSYLPILFLSIGTIGPFLALSSIVRGQFLIFTLVIITLLLIGKKAPFFTILVLGFFIIRPRASMTTAVVFFSGIAGLISLHQLQSTVDLSPFKILSGYFDYHINLGEVLNRINNQSCCFGIFNGNIAVSKLWYFIPRSFYESKPDIYSHILIHAEFYPNELARGYTRGIVTNIASAYADLGYFGLFFYGGTNALLFCFFLKMYAIERNSVLKSLYLLIVFNPIAPALYLIGFLTAATKTLLTRI